MKKKYIYIILTIFFTSCGEKSLFDNKEIIINNFPKTINLKGELKDINVLGIVDLTVIDTFLIAYTPLHSEYYCQIYSTSNHKYLGSFFPVGRGPNEFYAICYSNCDEIENGIAKTWYYNSIMRYRWNITESVKQQITIIDSTFYSKGIFSNGLWLSGHNHKMFGFTDIKTNIEYLLYDLKTNKEIHRNNIFSHNISKKIVPIVFMNPYIKPDNTKIAFIGWWTNNVCIFNSDFSNIKALSVYGKTISLRKVAETNRNERTLFYSCNDMTDQFIYSLYVNQAEKNRNYHSGNEEIHIFDWNGGPIMNIIIPENIMFFTVDEIHKCIYGLTSDELIYKYDLQEYFPKL